jgi:acid phosphatase (class A)
LSARARAIAQQLSLRPSTNSKIFTIKMRPFLKTLLLACLLSLTLGSTLASGPYLKQDAPNAERLLPPPPTLGSPEDRADRDEAFQVYSSHTAQQFALGEEQQNLTIFHLTDTLIPWFQPGKCPKTEALFKDVEADASRLGRAAKQLWKRPRPYKADPARFSNVVEHEDHPSYGYPSGHATRATLYALLLAELFPEHREALIAKGRESGWLRVQGGVHTPLDIYAGRTMGQALANAFLENAAFQKDLAEVKAEIAAARK